jgi:adenylate cyclase class 2
VAEELEITVSDFILTEKLLRGLGLLPKRGYPLVKHRVSYALGRVHFEFDTFPRFPTYMEIEAPSISAIKKYAGLLNLPLNRLRAWATRDVFAYYRKQGLLKD